MTTTARPYINCIYIYTQKNIDTTYPYILKKTSFPLFPDEQSHHSCFVDRQTFLIRHFWNSQLAQHIPNSPYPFAEPCDVFDVCDVWPRRRMKRNGRNACSAGFAGIHPMTWIWCLGDFVYSSMVIYHDIIYIYIVDHAENTVASLKDNACKGFSTTNRQSLVL